MIWISIVSFANSIFLLTIAMRGETSRYHETCLFVRIQKNEEVREGARGTSKEQEEKEQNGLLLLFLEGEKGERSSSEGKYLVPQSLTLTVVPIHLGGIVDVGEEIDVASDS